MGDRNRLHLFCIRDESAMALFLKCLLGHTLSLCQISNLYRKVHDSTGNHPCYILRYLSGEVIWLEIANLR